MPLSIRLQRLCISLDFRRFLIWPLENKRERKVRLKNRSRLLKAGLRSHPIRDKESLLSDEIHSHSENRRVTCITPLTKSSLRHLYREFFLLRIFVNRRNRVFDKSKLSEFANIPRTVWKLNLSNEFIVDEGSYLCN